MALVNYASREITCKIVYYGPGLSGKTTTLHYIHNMIPRDRRGGLVSLATDTDRTLFFDFLPVNIGSIAGFKVKFQLYTVPGQVFYDATRRLVLRGADGVVFVADSQLERLGANVESLKNLRENLGSYNYDYMTIPLVFQYNKRDLLRIASMELLERWLNFRKAPSFEGIATKGVGVFEALKSIGGKVLEELRAKYRLKTSVKL